jgi:hypothetical protein
MRKLLLPIALFLGGVLLLMAVAYWYAHTYGSQGVGPVPGYN